MRKTSLLLFRNNLRILYFAVIIRKISSLAPDLLNKILGKIDSNRKNNMGMETFRSFGPHEKKHRLPARIVYSRGNAYGFHRHSIVIRQKMIPYRHPSEPLNIPESNLKHDRGRTFSGQKQLRKALKRDNGVRMYKLPAENIVGKMPIRHQIVPPLVDDRKKSGPQIHLPEQHRSIVVQKSEKRVLHSQLFFILFFLP